MFLPVSKWTSQKQGDICSFLLVVVSQCILFVVGVLPVDKKMNITAASLCHVSDMNLDFKSDYCNLSS